MGCAQRPHGRSQRQNGFFGRKVRKASFIRSGERKVLTASTHPPKPLCLEEEEEGYERCKEGTILFLSCTNFFRFHEWKDRTQVSPIYFISQRQSPCFTFLFFFGDKESGRAIFLKTNLTHHKPEEKEEEEEKEEGPPKREHLYPSFRISSTGPTEHGMKKSFCLNKNSLWPQFVHYIFLSSFFLLLMTLHPHPFLTSPTLWNGHPSQFAFLLYE